MARTLHRSGVGPTVVLLHGLGCSRHVWKPVIDRLEPSYDVVALTLPGHQGRHVKKNRTMAVSTLAELLSEELDELGVGRAHLVGHSLGGRLALLLAGAGRARSVTVFSPAGGWQAAHDERDRLGRLYRQLRTTAASGLPHAAELLADPGARRAILGVMMEHGDRMPVPAAVHLWEALLGVKRLEELIEALDAPVAALGSDVPVSIVWPDEDHVLPEVICADGWRDAVPHAGWSVLEGVGHLPMYDDPAGVAARIQETVGRALS